MIPIVRITKKHLSIEYQNVACTDEVKVKGEVREMLGTTN
jgi:hypothetical protein